MADTDKITSGSGTGQVDTADHEHRGTIASHIDLNKNLEAKYAFSTPPKIIVNAD